MTFQPRSLAELAADWPEGLDHLSASSMKMAVRCPEQWRQRYVLGKKIPPSFNMLAGRADHAAIEKSMEQKIETFVDLPTQEVRDAFVERIEEDVDRAGGVGEIELRKGDELVTSLDALVREYDEIRRAGQDVVATYHQQVSPRFQPIAVEKRFELHPANLPVKVEGRIDLLAHESQLVLGESPAERPVVMIDRKRGSRARTKPEPEWVMQAEIYQLAEPVPHAWHVSVTTKSPRVILPDFSNKLLFDVVPRRRSEMLVEQIAGEIGYLYMKYGPDQPWPAKGKLHPWACNYCGFRPVCWGWADA